MTTLWTDSTAAAATSGKAQGSWQATRVVIDSRAVGAGDLFVAIKGDNFDGHDFVADALAKGAVAAMVSRVPAGLENQPLLIVDDAFKGLEALGVAARKACRAKIVGVTGSVGKTSTKEMLKLALSAHGKTHATTGNLNNHIGTPLNLANLPADTDFAVFEMGMNHAGEISHLTKMVQPHVAAITTVEAVHIEFFESIEGIADAKSEIFEAMSGEGYGIVNRDNPHYGRVSKNAVNHNVKHIITFGSHEKSDCRLIDYRASAEGCTISASIHGKHLNYSLKAVGRHWALTSLLTLAATHALGLDDEKTAKALAQFGELDGRGSLVKIPVAGGEAIIIDDSYNASPAAMRAAFAKTQEVWEGQGRKGRKYAALGNMLELGQDAISLHTGLVPDIESNSFDAVFTAGDLMKHLHDTLPSGMRAGHVALAMQLLPLLEKKLKAGDVLLVKGSHGSKMYELAKALTDKASPQSAGHKHAV
jgi:UDP-N-acetylmuramoyl-tripeptide--D-alanyl-D-alanine ligase